MTTIDTTAAPAPPKVSGDDGETGHLEELRRDPIGLMQRVRDECGDVGEFRLAGNDVVLLTGAEANEIFFRASDEDLDQAEAYPFMKPVFGEGIIFDASPERRREMLHNQSLRDKYMRGHAEKITREIERMVVDWGDEGEIDLLDWTAELFIYTSTSCLIGARFREELNRRFAELFHDLECGTDAIAFVDPYADIESFRRRDAARVELVGLIQEIMDRRETEAEVPADEKDLVDVLMSIRDEDGTLKFSADQITGMFISMMFAGHHTTSTTASWMIIELLRNPDVYERVTDELDSLFGPEVRGDDGSRLGESRAVNYQALREIPWMESALKETLRLHPPLILLLRKAMRDFEIEGFHVEAGKLIGASPAVSNVLPEVFDNATSFDPSRYIAPRADDTDNPWNWLPFGAGRHRCVGAAFALMQLKAIFCVLLRDWTFEMAQPAESYHNDHSKMVVQLAQPCTVRYRRRKVD